MMLLRSKKEDDHYENMLFHAPLGTLGYEKLSGQTEQDQFQDILEQCRWDSRLGRIAPDYPFQPDKMGKPHEIAGQKNSRKRTDLLAGDPEFKPLSISLGQLFIVPEAQFVADDFKFRHYPVDGPVAAQEIVKGQHAHPFDIPPVLKPGYDTLYFPPEVAVDIPDKTLHQIAFAFKMNIKGALGDTSFTRDFRNTGVVDAMAAEHLFGSLKQGMLCFLPPGKGVVFSSGQRGGVGQVQMMPAGMLFPGGGTADAFVQDIGNQADCLVGIDAGFVSTPVHGNKIADADKGVGDHVRVQGFGGAGSDFLSEKITEIPGNGFIIPDGHPVDELGFTQGAVEGKVFSGMLQTQENNVVQAFLEITLLRVAGFKFFNKIRYDKIGKLDKQLLLVFKILVKSTHGNIGLPGDFRYGSPVEASCLEYRTRLFQDGSAREHALGKVLTIDCGFLSSF